MDLTLIDLPTEVVTTERLVLRPYRPDDVEAVFRACSDAQTQRWISAIAQPYTVEDARAWVEEAAPAERAAGEGMPSVVEVDGELVGSAGVHFRPSRLGPEIGYWTAPWARGRGYAAEAAHALAAWAFGVGAERVHLYADVENAASQAVARRAGFVQEGVVRSCLEYRDGSRGDAALFSKLPGD